jgi:hypothetical protein
MEKSLRLARKSTAIRSLHAHTPAPFGKRYGPVGLRSSNSGITATVFGGYGFLGRYILNELGDYFFPFQFAPQLIAYFEQVQLDLVFMFHFADVSWK